MLVIIYESFKNIIEEFNVVAMWNGIKLKDMAWSNYVLWIVKHLEKISSIKITIFSRISFPITLLEKKGDIVPNCKQGKIDEKMIFLKSSFKMR